MDKPKINITQTILAILINTIIGYAFFYFEKGENSLVLGIVTGILLAIISFFSMAINFENQKRTANTKIISFLFYALIFIVNLIFVFTNFSLPIYFIINGILFSIYLILYSSIHKAKQ